MRDFLFGRCAPRARFVYLQRSSAAAELRNSSPAGAAAVRMAKRPAPSPQRLRTSGVLLHVTSLPGPYGIGDLGRTARAGVESLARPKQAWWQVLTVRLPG